jgi:hypothetical protein
MSVTSGGFSTTDYRAAQDLRLSCSTAGGFWFVSASLGLFSATRAWLGHMQTVRDNQG